MHRAVPRLVRPYSLIWMVGSAAWVAFLITRALHPAPVSPEQHAILEEGFRNHALTAWFMLGVVLAAPLALLWIGLLVAQDIITRARGR